MNHGLLSTAWAFCTPCRFMEFEAEEEMQIQNTQLMSGPQSLPPAAPLKLDPPGPPVPEVCPQPGKAIQCQQEPVARISEGVTQKPVTSIQGVACDVPNRTGISSLCPRLDVDLSQVNQQLSH